MAKGIETLPAGLEATAYNIDPLNNTSCHWCEKELQTVEHFALNCKVSKEIWRTSYHFLETNQEESLSVFLEEIFSASNISNYKSTQAAMWLHMNVMNEIWCFYTTHR
ncbi:23962_t:CDS:2 [Gigaspora margarita]|uniref:23962_t:CDS:1 n=1 Tax=Gigaspora margarita TaxID=4874 RepID=A0ABN7V7C2_GIGMA|nr:23962_t:CDS:2 [Gigaspora margarita]